MLDCTLVQDNCNIGYITEHTYIYIFIRSIGSTSAIFIKQSQRWSIYACRTCSKQIITEVVNIRMPYTCSKQIITEVVNIRMPHTCSKQIITEVVNIRMPYM